MRYSTFSLLLSSLVPLTHGCLQREQFGERRGNEIISPQEPSALQKVASKQKTDAPLLKLYGGPRTRTPIVQWYLEELEIPYKYISLDIRAKENRQPEFLAINPMGKVPAIVDDELKLWESGAILLYLADKHRQMPSESGERAKIIQWVFFANATLSPGLFLKERREKEMPRLLAPLNKILQKQSFITGDKLTVADIAIASYLYYAQLLLSLDFSKYPAVVTYLDRITTRPAFKKTLGKR